MTEQPNYLAYIRKRQKLIPKDDAVKVLTQYVSKFGTLSSGHRTEKGQFSFQSKERQCQTMLKLLHNCTHLTC